MANRLTSPLAFRCHGALLSQLLSHSRPAFFDPEHADRVGVEQLPLGLASFILPGRNAPTPPRSVVATSQSNQRYDTDRQRCRRYPSCRHAILVDHLNWLAITHGRCVLDVVAETKQPVVPID